MTQQARQFTEGQDKDFCLPRNDSAIQLIRMQFC